MSHLSGHGAGGALEAVRTLLMRVLRVLGVVSRIGARLSVALIALRTVDILLKDGFSLVDVKLGLEREEVVGVAEAIGTASRIGEGELLIYNLIARAAPVFLTVYVSARNNKRSFFFF